MSPAIATLLALLVAIALSIGTRINVGLVSIAFAGAIGVWADISANDIIRGFPSSLFLTLTGVTLLFAVAETNGTLERLAHVAFGLARGNARMLPLVFFVIACVLSSVGPGAISTVALVVPVAMAIGARAGVPHFLTALVVANGANAGNLSPISSVGIIANSRMAEAGLAGHEGRVWFANFAAHAVVTLVAWLALSRRAAQQPEGPEPIAPQERFNTAQKWTIALVLVWIGGVLGLGLDLGLSAFAAAVLLIAFRAGDQTLAIRRVPWGVILMVSGVTVLISLLQATGGMELFNSLLAALASPATINGVIAFVTGTISTYSSTSGVVLPAFLPAVPGLIDQLGGGDPLAVSLSINIGSALVDVSPLSTLGALCVAAVPDGAPAAQLFRRLLLWGLSMSVVGAILCQLVAGPLARW
ncbi:MAG: SLC13 family permease [Longimicrobiales bacterium]